MVCSGAKSSQASEHVLLRDKKVICITNRVYIVLNGVMQKMEESVKVHRVRCFTGTFGLTSRQMTKFALKLPMATPHVVCQKWLGTGSTDVFPSYTLLLGQARGMNPLERSDLLESKVAVANNWVPTLYPYEQIMPYWYPAHQHLEGDDLDWGYIKVKKVDPKRWIAHVHQVVFWCGTSQQGVAPRSRARQQWSKVQSNSRNWKAKGPLQSVKVKQM